jgi:hypothetical protein
LGRWPINIEEAKKYARFPSKADGYYSSIEIRVIDARSAMVDYHGRNLIGFPFRQETLLQYTQEVENELGSFRRGVSH